MCCDDKHCLDIADGAELGTRKIREGFVLSRSITVGRRKCTLAHSPSIEMQKDSKEERS